MQRHAENDPAAAAAGASGYLRLLGLVACGHCWLEMAIAAAGTLRPMKHRFPFGQAEDRAVLHGAPAAGDPALLDGLHADASLITGVRAEEL